jgi:hypothetical protein
LNRIRIKLSNASAPTRALILALFATVSAILSNFAGSKVYLNTQPLPGIYFGMVLGMGIWFWVSRSAWKILTVLLSTVIAWVAARNTAVHAFEAIHQMLQEIAAPGISPEINFMFAVCGVTLPPTFIQRQLESGRR